MNLVLNKALINGKMYSLIQTYNSTYWITVESDHPEVNDIVSSHDNYVEALKTFKQLQGDVDDKRNYGRCCK